MSPIAEDILKSFELLPEEEKRELLREIIRRTIHFEALRDEDLILIAEQLFLDLDAHEAADATSSAR